MYGRDKREKYVACKYQSYMKILFLTRGFPSKMNPMAGIYESVQAKAIAAKGHEVSVIAIKWYTPLHLFKFDRVSHRVVDGIHIYECNRITLSIPRLFLPIFEQRVMQWQFKRVFRRYLKEQCLPDVVHAHIIRYAVPAIFLKTEYNLPFVITEHWSVMAKKDTPKRVVNQTFAYHLSDKVICVSRVLAESLKEKCDIDALVINNMVDGRFFKSKKIEHHEGCFKFIGVGALRKGKRFDMLVDAFALCQFPDNVSLDIVGEGKERDLIESKIQQHNIGDKVKLLGVKTPEEVNDLLCHSDCFVLSSRLETFSIVLIEAMAKGLPVIATRCGGPETFVRPEDGVLVPKENTEELAKAMKNMIKHYQKYNGEKIRAHCHDNFSQNVIADKIISVYNQVLKK